LETGLSGQLTALTVTNFKLQMMHMLLCCDTQRWSSSYLAAERVRVGQRTVSPRAAYARG